MSICVVGVYSNALSTWNFEHSYANSTNDILSLFETSLNFTNAFCLSKSSFSLDRADVNLPIFLEMPNQPCDAFMVFVFYI